MIDDNVEQLSRAYHEAGHAVVAWKLGWQVESVEIENRSGWCGKVTAFPPENEKDANRAAYLAAGAIAQQMGVPNSQVLGVDQKDQNAINNMANQLITGPLLPPFGDPEDHQPALDFRENAENLATTILNDNWSRVESVAQALIVSLTLGDAEIADLLPMQSEDGGGQG